MSGQILSPLPTPRLKSRPRLAITGDSIVRNIALRGPDIAPSAGYTGNGGSGWVTFAESDVGTPAGQGALAWTAATRSFTWAAFGETAGPPVTITSSGLYDVYSSGGTCITLGVQADHASLSDVTLTPTVSNLILRRRNSYGWATALQCLCRAGFEIDRWGLAGGQTSHIADMVRRQIATSPDLAGIDAVVDLSGTNDIGAGVAAAAAEAAHVDLIRQLAGLGKPVFVLPILPRSVGNEGASGQAKLQHLNRVRAREAAKYANVAFLPVHTACTPLAATSAFLAAGDSPDQLHPGPGLAYKLARAVKPYLLQAFPGMGRQRTVYPDIYDATNNPKGNLIASSVSGAAMAVAQFAGTGGTPGAGNTGLAPSGWTGSRSGAISAAFSRGTWPAGDLAAGASDVCQIDLTGAAASTDKFTLQHSSAFNGVAQGQWLQAALELRAFNTVGLQQLELQLWFGAAGGYAIGNSWSNQSGFSVGQMLPDGADEILVIETPPFQVPAGFSGPTLSLFASTTAGGRASIQLLWADLRIVDAPTRRKAV